MNLLPDERPERANPPAGRPVIALAVDLMFAARIRGAAETAGVEVVLVRSADTALHAAAECRPRRIFIDLDARGVDAAGLIAALKADPQTRTIDVVAFVAHVNESAIAAARAAGADRVLARSAFVRELASLVRS